MHSTSADMPIALFKICIVCLRWAFPLVHEHPQSESHFDRFFADTVRLVRLPFFLGTNMRNSAYTATSAMSVTTQNCQSPIGIVYPPTDPTMVYAMNAPAYATNDIHPSWRNAQRHPPDSLAVTTVVGRQSDAKT